VFLTIVNIILALIFVLHAGSCSTRKKGADVFPEDDFQGYRRLSSKYLFGHLKSVFQAEVKCDIWRNIDIEVFTESKI